MSASWADQAMLLCSQALRPLADSNRAREMVKYMKDVAPFLGIAAPDRRRALREAWKELPVPSSLDLGIAATGLMHLSEREFHYAAYDLIGRYRGSADEYFLDEYITDLLNTKPWWDTVDGLVTAAVSPLCRELDAEWLIDEWSESGNRWLIRASITHQRGWKEKSNVERVLRICARHWTDREFFVAKAIGWALRDLAWLDPVAVERFLADQVAGNSVAVREARRGLMAQDRANQQLQRLRRQ